MEPLNYLVIRNPDMDTDEDKGVSNERFRR